MGCATRRVPRFAGRESPTICWRFACQGRYARPQATATARGWHAGCICSIRPQDDDRRRKKNRLPHWGLASDTRNSPDGSGTPPNRPRPPLSSTEHVPTAGSSPELAGPYLLIVFSVWYFVFRLKGCDGPARFAVQTPNTKHQTPNTASPHNPPARHRRHTRPIAACGRGESAVGAPAASFGANATSDTPRRRAREGFGRSECARRCERGKHKGRSNRGGAERGTPRQPRRGAARERPPFKEAR